MKFPKISFFPLASFFSSSTVSLQTALILVTASLLIGTCGFVWIENYSWIEAIYMAVITISTVGFTEVQPLSSSGQIFVSVLILLNIGIFAYALYAFTNYVIEGEIFKKMHTRLIEQRISQLENHVIVCGYGRYGQEICAHFQVQNLPFVVIDISSDVIKASQKDSNSLLYVEGDATHDEVLLKAGIKNARTLIAALPDDTDNVFTVLTARQLHPTIQIISRVLREKSAQKLKLAGANHTIMPEQIGGFYMAALVTKPGAVEFFSFIANEYESDIAFEEIRYEEAPDVCKDKSIADLHIRKNTGCNIIGYKSPSSRYIVNPSPDTLLVAKSSFIVLGSHLQIEALRKYLSNPSAF